MANRRKGEAIEIPFLGAAYEGRSKFINAQRSINLFPVLDQNEAKTTIAMYGTPGLTLFSSPATTAGVRCMHGMGSYMYAVVGAVVYEVESDGTATNLGSITTSSGHVSMADNGTQILVVDGTEYGHIITVGTLTDIDPGEDYPAATDCAFFDGYFVVSVASTGRIQISDSYDGLVWDALDFATAESASDNLVGLGTTKQNVWLIGALTTEVYFNSGNADFPLERVPGAIIDTGCNAIGSITEIDGKVYWLSHENKIVCSHGYDKEEISTPGIDYQLSTYSTTADADGYAYTLEGRTFYVLAFPTADKTWVFDVDSKQPHEWQSLDGSDDPEMHRCVSGADGGQPFNGKMLVGDRANGRLYELDMDVYTDNTVGITRIRRTQTINKSRVNVLHHRVEVEFEPGVGLDVAEGSDGEDPQANLKWSDDGGNNWSAGRSVDIGEYQEFGTRAIWRQLGKSRSRIYELTITDPVKVVLIGSDANLTPCRV